MSHLHHANWGVVFTSYFEPILLFRTLRYKGLGVGWDHFDKVDQDGYSVKREGGFCKTLHDSDDLCKRDPRDSAAVRSEQESTQPDVLYY